MKPSVEKAKTEYARQVAVSQQLEAAIASAPMTRAEVYTELKKVETAFQQIWQQIGRLIQSLRMADIVLVYMTEKLGITQEELSVFIAAKLKEAQAPAPETPVVAPDGRPLIVEG